MSASIRSCPAPENRTTADSLPREAHLQAALDGVATGLLSFDQSLAVLITNDRLAAMLAIPLAVLRACRTVADVFNASTIFADVVAREAHEACLSIVSLAEPPASMNFTSACGQRFFTLLLARVAEGHWMASFEETTARRIVETQALQQAMRDPLTGLCNRKLFETRVAAAFLAGGERAGLAVLLLDLDRFKAVNDTLGHPVGDALLRLVARRLLSLVRQDDLVARLGGDEFAILVSATLEDDAVDSLARRIVDVLGRPYLVDGHLVNIGASIGIAVAPEHGQGYGPLIQSADLALYAAKNAGRSNYQVFEAAMEVRAMARRALEIDLRRAMALREFELHYQPQVDLERDTIVGFEALVRWRHPTRGLVPPVDFIPMAEEIGLILSLGEWVMREACLQAARWPADVSVAVNVSPHQFEDTARLVDSVSKALAWSQLPGHRLEIEITESVLLRNEKTVLAALHRIRDMGVRVAMDDFGTGYSSLSQLHSFPFNKIKIDRSFVKENGDPSGQSAIIRAVTALGISLGMATIAEGVETPDQLARIRAEGCMSVQGYLFSKPVPVEQVDVLLASFAVRRNTVSPSNGSDERISPT